MKEEQLERSGSREVLEEMLAWQKKEVRHSRIATLANIALVFTLVVIVLVALPRAIRVVNRAETALVKLDTFMDQAKQSLTEIDRLVDNTNDFVTENTDSMTEVVEQINSVDFEKLNEAIAGLSDAIKPMAEFARLFGN